MFTHEPTINILLWYFIVSFYFLSFLRVVIFDSCNLKLYIDIRLRYERRPESKHMRPPAVTGNSFSERWHHCDLWRDVTNKSRPKPFQYVEISARGRFSRWTSYRALPLPLSLIQSVKWEARSVFSSQKGVISSEIRRRLVQAHGPDVMNHQYVAKLVRKWRIGERTNVRDEERGGRPSVVTDDFVQKSGTIHLRFTPSFHSRGVAQAFLDLFFRKRSRIDLTTGNCARKLYEDHKDFTTKKL